MSYTIFCIQPGGSPAFHVDIAKTQTVDHLKDAIKLKMKPELDALAAHALSLYRVTIDAPDMEKAIEEAEGIFQGLSTSENIVWLNPIKTLESIFGSSGPPPETIHILVLVPGALKRKDRTEPTVVSEPYNPVLAFETNEVGAFDDTVPGLNSIHHTANSAFIAGIKEQLKEKRFISDVQRDILGRAKIDVNAHFEVDTRNDNCEDAEIACYVLLSVPDSARSNIMTKPVSKGKTHPLFRYISTYLCEQYSGGTFKAEATWPFHLVARVDDTPTSYRPRSDFMFLLDGYPFLLVEVCSDPEHRDRYRLLVHAGILVRVMNSIKPKNKDSFVAVAVYITETYTAERYLVYQPSRDSKVIEYVEDSFCLKTPHKAFMFFFELHNLLSALPPDVELSKAASRFSALSRTVKDAKYPSYSAIVKDKKPKSKGPNNIPPSGSSSRPFDDPTIVRKLSDAGYRVLRLPMGFKPLYPLPPNLSRARRLAGENVVLKLVKSDELAIHSFLSSIKSKYNHTIPILDRIALGIETIIAMPVELALPHVPEAVLKTGGNSLAYQFLEGVRFMHQHNVAHLDLKPDNIVVTRCGQQLSIIDLNLSVQVPEQESWIKGYRGTEEWTAPEIEEPDPVYRPIRADLWSAGRMLQWFANSQHSDTGCPFKSLMNALLSHDPAQRPLLSETRLPYEEDQAWKLKRKRVDDALENQGVKRNRVQFGDDALPQVNTQVLLGV